MGPDEVRIKKLRELLSREVCNLPSLICEDGFDEQVELIARIEKTITDENKKYKLPLDKSGPVV